MKDIYCLILVAITILATTTPTLSQDWIEKGDSIIVQTFTYDSIHTRRATFKLPPEQKWEKILMHYALKCDPRTPWDRFDCGEWDYLTYTVVQDSSGRFDSTKLSQPNFVVRNTLLTEYSYTSNSVFDRTLRKIRTAKYLDLENIENIKFESDDNHNLKFSNTKYGRILTLIPNITPESINELSFLKIENIFINELDFESIKISAKMTSHSSIPENHSELFSNSDIVFDGISNSFTKNAFYNFVKKINISEKSNLLLQIDYTFRKEQDGEVDLKMHHSEGQDVMTVFTNPVGYHLKMSTGDYVEVDPTIFNQVDKEITISVWQKGDPERMPANSFLFEAWNSNNQRVMNVHLPWSNSRVYWDCGNIGGNYDRIDKEAVKDDFAGKWNHWVFVKNAEFGTMQIYLNGELWHSGTDLRRPIENISRFRIGSNGNYWGDIDEFSVWNKALDPFQIRAIYKNSEIGLLSNQLPQEVKNAANNQILYLDFDEVSDTEFVNKVNNQVVATAFGLPNKIFSTLSDIRKNFDYAIPHLALELFFSSETPLIETVDLIDTTYRAKNTVFLYNRESLDRVVPINELQQITTLMRTATDTLYVWEADVYSYLYDEDNTILDSTFIPAEKKLIRRDLEWFSPLVNYEVDRFITPYGINLDLGPDGFTWVYDLTDFGPILHDYINLTAANTQELVDLKFIFIKGTPERDINKIQYIWKEGGTSANIEANLAIPPTKMMLDNDSKQFRVKTRSSGHGFAGGDDTFNCGEFCPRMHNLWIDGKKVSEWNGWQECGDNPVFPQGGTWLLDRADWCPAKEVNTYNHEITNFVEPGKEYEFNYYMEAPGQNHRPYGNYVFTGFLVSYGDFNFQTDAEVYDIISPNTKDEYSRMNPICAEPKVRIKNRGANSITSLVFSYGVVGGAKFEYEWTGEINSLEFADIALPTINWDGADNSQEFEVVITAVNGGVDEYPKNNKAISKFELPNEYGNKIEIITRTNNFADQQYSLTVTKSDGTVVLNRGLGQFESNRNYNDVLELEEGCYIMDFKNSLGYGLDYWPIRNQLGSGSIRVSSGPLGSSFTSDFGNKIVHQFIVAQQNKVEVSQTAMIFKEANSSQIVKVFPLNKKGITIYGFDLPFGEARGFTISNVSPEIVDNQKGVYIPLGDTMYVEISFNPKDTLPKNATLRIRTNDFEKSSVSITLQGNVPPESVEWIELADFNITLSDNPNKGLVKLKIISEFLIQDDIFVEIFTPLGEKVLADKIIYSGGKNAYGEFDISSFADGLYYFTVSIGARTQTSPLILIK